MHAQVFRPDLERWSSNQTFTGTTKWPEPGQIVAKLMAKGLQQDGDLELRLGFHVGPVAPAATD